MDTGFVSDIYLPQMLYAVTVRSPVANGRLVSIECPQLPDGYLLVTAKDIPGKNFIDNFFHPGDTAISMPVLASDRVSYIGEPVALLIGPDKNVLEGCIGSCIVNAEEETPVFTKDESKDDLVFLRRDIHSGEPEAAFASAGLVLSSSYAAGIQEHWSPEPAGAVAWFYEQNSENEIIGNVIDKNDKKSKNAGIAAGRNPTMVVQAATQWAYHVKKNVTQVLGFTDSAVMVKPAKLCITTDDKTWYPTLLACHAALGAWVAKKPVRLVLTRYEDFLYSPKRSASEIEISSAHNEKGNIAAIKIKASVNTGSYEVNAEEALHYVYLGCQGVYNLKNMDFSGTVYKTNIPPQGQFSGFNYAQGIFALETHISRMTNHFGINPAEWRIENLGKTNDSASVAKMARQVIAKSDYQRKWSTYELIRNKRKEKGTALLNSWSERKESLRGIGIAIGQQDAGLQYPACNNDYSLEVTLEKDGSVEILASLASTETDYIKIWSSIVTKILGVNADKIRINCNSDAIISGPSVKSRKTTVLTRLVEQCCVSIYKQHEKKQPPITVRKTIALKKNNENYLDNPGWASAVVEIETDPVEFVPKIRGIWMSVNGGKILDENNAHAALKKSAIQALNWVYREHIHYVKGIIPDRQFEDFEIMDINEIPPINIELMDDDANVPRGIGDLPFACIPAAYAQAISQVMDYTFESLPLSAMNIWYAGVRKKNLENPA